MVLVPEARLAHQLPIAITPEPSRARRIKRLLPEIAEKRDRVALDVAATAFRTGLIIDGKPKERHSADHLSHFAFERILGRAHVCRRIAALSPSRKIISVTRHDRRSNQQSENRSSVIASACLLLTAMLLQPAP
jgi:hypothetical protein